MLTQDFLTGLPNRLMLQDRLTQAFALAKRQRKMFAVLSLDIDDFKKINDTYGHSEGDRLLVEMASRIRGTLRDVDTVARIGGDEFIALIPEIDSDSQMEVVADRLLAAVGRPFSFGSETIALACQLGCCALPRSWHNARDTDG